MADLVNDQAQVTTLQAQLSQIAAANSTLNTITVATQTMGQQLGGFTDIWGAVKNDCTEVSTWIESINNPFSRNIVGILAYSLSALIQVHF
jgi:hypothetical protein